MSCRREEPGSLERKSDDRPYWHKLTEDLTGFEMRHTELTMGTKVFRPGGPFLLFGLMFTLAPIALGIACVNSLNEGTFTSNGHPVAPGDPLTLLGIIGFISVFVVAGLLMCGYAWLGRLEVRDDRVRIFNLLGVKTFDAAWKEISDYKRVPGGWSNMSSQWQIATIFATAKLPANADEPSMQLAMIDHLPPEVIEAERRPVGMEVPISRTITGTIRSKNDVFGAVFSVAWYLIVVLIGFVAVTKTLSAPHIKPIDVALPVIWLGFFAVAPASLFRDIWRRLVNGSFSVDENGIRYTDGVKSFGSPWAKLRFIECRTITYRRSSGSYGPLYQTVEQLILISGESGILLDSNMPDFSQVKAMALANAPSTALVFSND